MTDSGTSSSDGSSDDGSTPSEPTISFDKGSTAGAGPVYGAPDPNYTTPNYTTPNVDDQGGVGSAPGAGYPPPYMGGPQFGGPQYGGPPYAGGPGYMDPMAPYGRHPVTGEPFSDKQKLTAGLLGILLGAFGAGRFYLNQPGMAVAQIAVTWLTCGIGGIWPLIDGIMMLTGSVRDQHGRPLRD